MTKRVEQLYTAACDLSSQEVEELIELLEDWLPQAKRDEIECLDEDVENEEDD